MANPPKQKGTGFEREVKKRLEGAGFKVRRTPAGHRFDLEVEGDDKGYIESIHVLATRPDFGRALITMDMEDFLWLLKQGGPTAWIECKRFKRIAHHTLFENEVG